METFRLLKIFFQVENSDLITAIGHIAKSIGITRIAHETGLSRPGYITFFVIGQMIVDG